MCFNIGDGDDTVHELGAGSTDVFVFNGQDYADATFSRLVPNSPDMLIEMASGDTVVVIDAANGGYTNSIEQFIFDDQTVLWADISVLL